tara:strand:+ start:324 stop:464 length:141 start_codon:yes stop_codon:yes gene_type:complete
MIGGLGGSSVITPGPPLVACGLPLLGACCLRLGLKGKGLPPEGGIG